MNKIIKIMSIALLGGFAAACSDDDNTPAGVVGSADIVGAYFSTDIATTFTDLQPEDTAVSLTLLRNTTSGASTVNLQLSDDSGIFSIPSSVSFADGSNSTTFQITFDGNDLEPYDYPVTITVPSDYAYVYGIVELELTLGLAGDYRYVTIGTAQFNDAFFFDDFYEVEVQQHVVDTNVFRLVDPYTQGYMAEYGGIINASYPPCDYLPFTIAAVGETVYTVKITRDDIVYYADFSTGYYHSSYSDLIYGVFPGRFSSLRTEEDYSHNIVKSWQDNGLPSVVQIAPYYYMFSVGGWNYTADDNMILIIFPGGRLSDYTAEVEVTSVDVPEDGGDVRVKADVVIGGDVTSARVAIVAGNDPSGAYKQISQGEVEYSEITSSGEVTLTLDAESASGQYMVMAVTYLDGAVKEYGYDVFTYTPAGVEPWAYYCTGTYTYDIFFGSGTEDPGLEMYQSLDDPTLFKIEHWAYDVDFKFNMDEDGYITVADQWTGYNHSSYGAVYVDDIVDYFGSTQAGISFYKRNIFNFNVVYYVNAGYFGYGYETFQVTSWQQEGNSAPRRAPRTDRKPSFFSAKPFDLSPNTSLIPEQIQK